MPPPPQKGKRIETIQTTAPDVNKWVSNRYSIEPNGIPFLMFYSSFSHF
jgi:hypothetical protein